MATQATAQVLAKGPLSSALGQWAFLGFGTFVIFTGDNGISRAAQEIASVAFRLATGWDGSALLREAALAKQAAAASLQAQPQQPIIIHSAASTDGARGGGWTGTVVQLGLGAGACWTAYLVFANFLPDQVKEMLPVTRRFFETAVSSLGQGIIRVRDLLSEQISALGAKQDELSRKQDETHDRVLGLKDDIGHVRLDIDDVAAAISRCEDSLSDAAGRQTYMSRGVRLLVQCVGDLLRPSNPSVAEELDQFSRLSAELMDDRHDFGSPGRGTDVTATRSKSFECPSSPNLSEIGSTASTARRDDHHPHAVRSLSLPRARPGRGAATPAPNPAPPGLMGMSTPRLRLMPSFADRVAKGGSDSDDTATTAASSGAASSDPSGSESSPENEVPRNNSFCAYPPLKMEDMDVDDVLRFVRSGGDRNSIGRI